MPTRPTLCIADPHPIVRHGLAAHLGESGGFRIVGAVGNAQNAVHLCRDQRPDVLLIEPFMPGLDPLSAVTDIRTVSPTTRIVLFTALCRDVLIEESLARGVNGYLLKSDSLADLKDSLIGVLKGGRAYSREVAARITPSAGGTGGPVTPLGSLHPRELEVLRYIGRGMSNAEMAKLMHLSIRTVERHVLRLMRSLKIAERTRLTALAHQSGLVN